MRTVVLGLACTALLGAGLWPTLDEHQKYEVQSRVLQPVFRLLHSQGLFWSLVGKPDGRGFKLGRGLRAEAVEQLQSLRFGADDVVIVTWPKSGTHLLMQHVTQVLSNGTRDFASIHECLTLLEFDFSGCHASHPTIASTWNYQDVLPKPYVHSTHLHPAQFHVSDDAKYILMVRSPLDALVSLQEMMSKMIGPRLAPTVAEVASGPFSDGAFGYSYGQFHRDWLARAPRNLLVLFYEEAVQNMTLTTERLAAFLGRTMDQETVERVTTRSSMGYMKAIKERMEPPGCMQLPFPIRAPGKVDMVNKGKSERGKQVPAEIKQQVKEDFLKYLQGTAFPVERYLHTFD